MRCSVEIRSPLEPHKILRAVQQIDEKIFNRLKLAKSALSFLIYQVLGGHLDFDEENLVATKLEPRQLANNYLIPDTSVVWIMGAVTV